MPHYFRLERTACQRPGCRKRAEGTLFNGQNAPVGKFCEQHGMATVAELNAAGDRGGRASWVERLSS